MKKFFKRYRSFLVGVVMFGIIFLIDQSIGKKAIETISYSVKEMMLVIPPIFILLGLLDVWVPRETMVKYMGNDSGIKGSVLAFVLGSAAAGPLYAAFPVAAVFMKKGARLMNVFIFIGAWSTTKIPMILFEISGLGLKFAMTRLLINIPGIVIIAVFICKMLTKKEKETIYNNAQNID